MSESDDAAPEAEDRLRQQIEAYHVSGLVHAAVKLGLPDRMGTRPWTAEDLGQELGLASPRLLRFLRALTTIGVCEELPDGSFALSDLGQSLTTGSPTRLREKVMIVVEQYWWPWANLVPCLQTGTPAFEQLFGKPVGEWRAANREYGALFDSYLAKESFAHVAPIVQELDFSSARIVADIDGGYGGLLAAILQANPHLKGVLFERPQIIGEAEPFLQSRGVGERVERVGGDVFVGIPVLADIYLLKIVLPQWDDEKALVILHNLRAVMPEGARLTIIERLMPERACDDPAAVMVDLHMMVINGGKCRSLGALKALLSEARLAVSKVTPTTLGLTVIEAVGV